MGPIYVQALRAAPGAEMTPKPIGNKQRSPVAAASGASF